MEGGRPPQRGASPPPAAPAAAAPARAAAPAAASGCGGLGSQGQHLDDVGGRHGVDLPADLEQHRLGDGGGERDREAEPGPLAEARLERHLAAHPGDRALDDVEAHAPPGQPVGRLAGGEAGLKQGGQQLLVAERRRRPPPAGARGPADPLPVDAAAVVLEADEDGRGPRARPRPSADPGPACPGPPARRGLDPVGHRVAQQVQQGLGQLLAQAVVDLDLAPADHQIGLDAGAALELAQGVGQALEGPVEGDAGGPAAAARRARPPSGAATPPRRPAPGWPDRRGWWRCPAPARRRRGDRARGRAAAGPRPAALDEGLAQAEPASGGGRAARSRAPAAGARSGCRG